MPLANLWRHLVCMWPRPREMLGLLALSLRAWSSFLRGRLSELERVQSLCIRNARRNRRIPSLEPPWLWQLQPCSSRWRRSSTAHRRLRSPATSHFRYRLEEARCYMSPPRLEGLRTRKMSLLEGLLDYLLAKAKGRDESR